MIFKNNLVKINIWTWYLSLVKRIWNFSQKGMRSGEFLCPQTLKILINCQCLPLLLYVSYLLVFQMWIISGSVILCCSACSSNKSKKYLTARGTGRLVLRIAVNKSSTNFCRVPWHRQSATIFFIIAHILKRNHALFTKILMARWTFDNCIVFIISILRQWQIVNWDRRSSLVSKNTSYLF